MPKFSPASLEKLNTCDERLQRLFQIVVGAYDCTILVGHRGKEEQNRAVDEERSKVRWPSGRHNTSPSMAVDVAPYPIDWKNTKRFYHFAGYAQAMADLVGLKLRWGGDWDRDFDLDDQDFMDLVHFEIVD